MTFSCDRLQPEQSLGRVQAARDMVWAGRKSREKASVLGQKCIETVGLLDGRPRKEAQEMERKREKEKMANKA